MQQLIYFKPNDLNKALITRNGEVKLGEVMQLIDPALPLKQALSASKATYIVFGVPGRYRCSSKFRKDWHKIDLD